MSNSLLSQESWSGRLYTAADIAIIGAGLSGLTAAYRILNKDPSLRVIVLEAKDDFGGRTQTVLLKVAGGGKEPFDVGGQWVDSGQDDIMLLLDELDITSFPQYRDGKKVFEFGAHLKTEDNCFIPACSWYCRFQLNSFVRKVENIMKRINWNEPLEDPYVKELDSMTLETFLNCHLQTQLAVGIMKSFVQTCIGAESSQISALYFISFVNGKQGFINKLKLIFPGDDTQRIMNGAHYISMRLAEEIGDSLELGDNVMEVVQLDETVDIMTASQKLYRCQYAIMAIPPSEVQKIHFMPPLPAQHKKLLDHFPAGHMIKFVATYNELPHGLAMALIERSSLADSLAASISQLQSDPPAVDDLSACNAELNHAIFLPTQALIKAQCLKQCLSMLPPPDTSNTLRGTLTQPLQTAPPPHQRSTALGEVEHTCGNHCLDLGLSCSVYIMWKEAGTAEKKQPRCHGNVGAGVMVNLLGNTGGVGEEGECGEDTSKEAGGGELFDRARGGGARLTGDGMMGGGINNMAVCHVMEEAMMRNKIIVKDGACSISDELKNTNDNDNMQAFWREKELSGEAVSDGGLDPAEFPISMTYDLTTPGGHPAIGGHITGSQMDSFILRSAEKRKQLVLHHLLKLFGEEALKPIDYVEKNWCEELYIGGCPIQYLTPGVMSCKHFMRQPFIRVYWAGTEAAVSWFGYMNGAVQAGNVAALETLYQLRPQCLTAHDLIQVHRCFPVTRPPSGIPWWLLWVSLGLIGVTYIAYRMYKR
ncbi:amine oxidase [flavin-containing] A [Schistocerca americana]|uniref:amine oxidase [flavin-containing] A n=1 Tax=Schistocerca americana TaxID=7009 RepID=UPI001F4FB69E|nr:amine oxidase [flavin-containing] A [Schistocerca americana]